MSDSQIAWEVVWSYAEKNSGPFEIEEVVPEIASRLDRSEAEARRLVNFLLVETGRLPDGNQFFCVEGSAVVTLPEYAAALGGQVKPIQAYPFEL